MEEIGDMQMKLRKIGCATICGALLLTLSYPIQLHAEDFTGRESEMNQKCAAIYDEATQAQCAAYKEYLNNKAASLEGNVDNIKNQIAAVKDDISKVSAQITENNKMITDATASLEQIQATMVETTANIATLNTQIEEKIIIIKERDEQMKARLVDMQPYIGTNNFIDFLMGATSFTDLLRRSAIVGELNSYEQQQIELLGQEKKELENKQADVKLKQELLVAQEKEVAAQKAVAEKYKSANEELLVYYQQQEATLAEQKRKAQVESGEFSASIPNIDLTIIPKEWEEGGSGDSGEGDAGTGDVPSLSNGWVVPIQGTWYRSAGTWAYPGGGEHLGMDFGTYNKVGLSVVAPAAGIIVAIHDGVPNHGVYESGLGSWTGYPSGGGNTLHMIVNVDGVSYGISFYHLSPGMFNVKVGDIVAQGQLIARTGHSGNSSGPHCHVEVTKLGNVSISQGVQIFYNYGKDYFYGNWNSGGRCDIKGTTPCLLRPESFFGY